MRSYNLMPIKEWIHKFYSDFDFQALLCLGFKSPLFADHPFISFVDLFSTVEPSYNLVMLIQSIKVHIALLGQLNSSQGSISPSGYTLEYILHASDVFSHHCYIKLRGEIYNFAYNPNISLIWNIESVLIEYLFVALQGLSFWYWKLLLTVLT
jgi:hypothetical protein